MGQYRFYKLLFDASMSNIKISVTPQNKEYDVDLYVSWTCFEPGTDANNYDYHCVETGAAQITINNNEENNHLYIGVHGFDNNEKEQKEKEEEENEILYTLNVTNISLNDLEIANLHRASSLTTHDDETLQCIQIPQSSDPNKIFCSNCHRFVNKWSFDRHFNHCKKQFFYCTSCKQSIKMSELTAHNKTFHNDLKCKLCDELICGGKKALIAHQKYECLRRAINCSFCHLPFEYLAHSEHEIMCGSRTELCVVCNQYIALSLIEEHCIDVHGIEYEAPLGIARMKSDESVQNMNLGGHGAPDRDYDDIMNENDEKETNDALHERWICSSCDYNNRPNHRQCKICKVKRTKYMKTVSQMDSIKMNNRKKNNFVEKIGGNVVVPNRDYDALLNDQESDTFVAPIKPPLIQYNKQQQNDDSTTKESEIVIASGLDPSLIPKRDYDKMLNATIENIDEEFEDANDVQMDDENVGQMHLSTNIDAIPQRDYNSMLQ